MLYFFLFQTYKNYINMINVNNMAYSIKENWAVILMSFLCLYINSLKINNLIRLCNIDSKETKNNQMQKIEP